MKKRLFFILLGFTLAASVFALGADITYASEYDYYDDSYLYDENMNGDIGEYQETEPVTEEYVPEVIKREGIEITKDRFKTCYDAAMLMEKYSADGNDGIMTEYEQKYTSPWDCVYIPGKVKDVKGLEEFIYRDTVKIGNFAGTTLKLPDNIKRVYINPTGKSLKIVASNVKEIYISEATKVEDNDRSYRVRFNSLAPSKGKCKSIDISGCKKAEVLSLGLESVEKLTFPKSGSKLTVINLHDVSMSSLDLSSLKKLECVQFYYGLKLTSLNLSGAANLKCIQLSAMPVLKNVDLSNNKALKGAAIEDGINVKFPAGFSTEREWNAVYRNYTAVRESYDKKYPNWLYTETEAYLGNGYTKEELNLKDIKITKKAFPYSYKFLQNRNHDSNGDKVLDALEIYNLKKIGLTGAKNNLSELKVFPNLEAIYLYQYKDTKLTVKDKKIKYIYVDSYMDSLIIDAPYAKVICSGYMMPAEDGVMSFNGRWEGEKKLTTVDFSRCKSAVSIESDSDTVKSIILPKETKNLQMLMLSRVKGQIGDISKYKNLKYLMNFYNDYPVDVSKNTKLKGLWLASLKPITVDISNAKDIEGLCLQRGCSAKLAPGVNPVMSYTYNHYAYLVEDRLKLNLGI